MKSISNTTNCLALTVKKEYRLTVIKNITTKSLIITNKILFAVIVLNIANLFV